MIDEAKLIDELYALADKESRKCDEAAEANLTDIVVKYNHGESCYFNAVEAVNSQPKIGGWIPCSERLPEEKGWYLVYAKNQRPFVAYFKGKTFPLNNHYHEIVAWMSLPEPYEEKENG